MYRRSNGELEVFLVHPGGPFWAKKDMGAWSICKGEYARASCHWKLPNANSRKKRALPLKGIFSSWARCGR